MTAHLPALNKEKKQLKSLKEMTSAPAPVAAPLSEEDAEKAQKAREEKIKKQNQALEARRSQKDAVIRAIAHQGTADGGAIGKAEHLAGLTAEGVSGEMIADLFIFTVELVFCTPIWVQMWQFNKALEQELVSIKNGEPVRLAYMPNEQGDYPEIYPIDAQGKVDFSKLPMRTYNDDGSLNNAITPFHIRANGYVPRPSISESFKIVFDRHFERMLGAGVLSPEQKARMSGTLSSASDRKGEVEDLASDAASQNAMKGPTPSKK